MVGKTLDNRYKLEKKIGSGGMADVYMATDLLLDRVVAVKVLHSSFAEDNDFIVRFRHEAQSAGKLTHPNIVGIYDVGDDVTILNPGSISYPRQSGRKPTFLIMEIDEEGQAHYAHGYYKEQFDELML